MSKTKTTSLSCLKHMMCEVRLGSEFNNRIAYLIARAVSQELNVESVVIGYDARETSKSIAASVSQAVRASGANSYTIGLAGTEEVYWAVTKYNSSAGIVITASHNPIDFNGMKIIKKGSQPLEQSEFLAIKALAEDQIFKDIYEKGKSFDIANDAREGYLKKY